MTAARKLAAVPAAPPVVKPRLRRITKADAERAHPHNEAHQRLWLRAVAYLRTKSRCGWKRDQPVQRVNQKESKT